MVRAFMGRAGQTPDSQQEPINVNKVQSNRINLGFIDNIFSVDALRLAVGIALTPEKPIPPTNSCSPVDTLVKVFVKNN
ncbi:hypothetical protein NIES4075_65140 [Tolypothrix sp. NIES-4075]|uniref:hypothetical protein n=1 Tax=Tolypothrix sp. NIES-4075 TaxID=2005459 RepID=UPI000B6CC27D|nr:hypothetical protein [Tolypothrix sp. NIES-4075]GAX45493.1 hypothetical protein NIES4075_65140 [Tolypothrix sp. NIES-4075]